MVPSLSLGIAPCVAAEAGHERARHANVGALLFVHQWGTGER